MPGIIPVSPKQAFADAAGGPLANGTLTTYLAGTTTPTPTWQDISQSVLNTNPIVLDARGECLIRLDPSLTYKFELKDSGGATIWTVDNINGAAGNASQVAYTPEGTGAVTTTVQNKLRDIVSVMDYIPVAERAAILAGTSVYDCTAAIQAAITFATPTLPGNPWDLNGSRGGFVYIPRGRWIISSTIFIPAWVTVGGAGRAATQIYWGTAAAGPMFSMGRPGLAVSNDPLQSFHCGLRDLTLFGNYLNVTGLEIYASFWEMYGVCVARCNYNGIRLQTSYTGKAYSTWVFNCATAAGYAGIIATGAAASVGANDISWFGGSLGECYDLVRLEQTDQMTFHDFSFQSAWRHAVNLVPGGTVSSVAVLDSHFEANAYVTAGSSIFGNLSGFTLERSYFARQGANHQKHVAGIAFGGCRIVNNSFDDLASPAGFIGLVDEAAVSCTFVRNLIQGNSSPNDSIPLFTPALKVFVDAELFTIGQATLNRVDHLTQYRYQNHFNNTYTVTLTPATSGTITLSENTAFYQRVANLVHVQGRVTVGSVSSPVGTSVRISLPFTIATIGAQSAAKIGGVIIDSGATARVFTGTEAQAYVSMIITAASITGGNTFQWSFSYYAVSL